MLKLSGVVKTTPFEFTDLDGSTHKLEVSEYNIADVKKLIKMQEPAVDDTKMDIADRSNLIVSSRIVCAVKVEGTSVPFWNTVEEFTSKGYPNSLINALYPIVNELNPVSTEALDEKKSAS